MMAVYSDKGGRGTALVVAALVTVTHFAFIEAADGAPTSPPQMQVASAPVVEQATPRVTVAARSEETELAPKPEVVVVAMMPPTTVTPTYCQDLSAVRELPPPMQRRCVGHVPQEHALVALAALEQP